MATLKSFPWLRERIRIHLTEWGYDVQVYGQTVMRTTHFREATRFAAALERAFSNQKKAGDLDGQWCAGTDRNPRWRRPPSGS